MQIISGYCGLSVMPGTRDVRQMYDPNAIHSEGLQIIQLFGDAAQVTVSVAVAVFEGTHRDFIKYCIFVPEIIFI
jgi:hypothetical protein